MRPTKTLPTSSARSSPAPRADDSESGGVKCSVKRGGPLPCAGELVAAQFDTVAAAAGGCDALVANA